MLSVSLFKQLPLYILGGGWKGLGWRQLIAGSSRPSIFGALLGLCSRSDGYTKPKSHSVPARKTFLGRFTAQLDHHFKSKKIVNESCAFHWIFRWLKKQILNNEVFCCLFLSKRKRPGYPLLFLNWNDDIKIWLKFGV